MILLQFSNSIIFLDKVISIEKNEHQLINYPIMEYKIIFNYVDGKSSVIKFESKEERDNKFEKIIKDITEEYNSIKI